MNGNSNLPATTKLVTSKMMEADSVFRRSPGFGEAWTEFHDDEADR
jgi:hypothetical protein